ncbi:MAG: membrane protein insertion efficiency factor YidD [Acidobacteriota bacterium]
MRWIARLLLLLCVVVAAYDLTRPPAQQVCTRVALTGIRLYQSTVSPLVASTGAVCRFRPSCSQYAAAVIARDGVLRGTWLAARRIVRCGPWTPMGTVDQP